MTGNSPGPAPTGPISGFTPTYLHTGDTLARVYNHTRGHRCLSFNPNIPIPRTDGGRFDRSRAEDSPTMYGARVTKKHGAYTAVVETLRSLFDDGPPGQPQTIQRSELACRSVQFFEVRRELILASLHLPRHLRQLNATEEVTFHGDRVATQDWGSYFQSKLPPIVSGLAYNSTPSTRNKGSSFVLWGDRIDDENIFKPIKGEQSLGEGKFRRSVDRILESYNVLVLGDI